jgi:lactoylglutathione lyase
MLNQVCVLTVQVSDIEKGVKFYTDILDFKVAKYYGENIVQLEHNGVPFIIEKASETQVPSSSRVLFGIQSSNIQKDFKQLQEKGVTILSPEPLPCPPGYFFTIEDFSGNAIEIVEFVEQKEH